MPELRFASALSRATDPAEIANELTLRLGQGLMGAKPDLALAFISGHLNQAPAVADALCASLNARICVGCTAESVIGRNEEIEREDAVSVVAASLPGAEMVGFAVAADDWPEVLSDPALLRARLGAGFEPKLFILFADPFTSPMDDVLELFNAAYPGVPIVGGMASAANAVNAQGGESNFTDVLFLNQGNFVRAQGGAVGVALAGEIEIDVVVSQGCRPIGRPLVVTQAEKNILISLEDQAPMSQLQELFDQLSEEDRDLLRNGVYLGRAINSGQEELGRGDFLIRGLMGADPEHGYLAVGDFIQPGERVQFHLHDAQTATEDLEMLLLPQTLQDAPAGAFVFSCNGRGTRLYDHPNGDVETIQQFLNDVPIGGFFCAGELGPVGGRNFLHSQTVSMVIFRSVTN
jgi:small ligand-binding sensory domain FIST